MRYAIYSNHWYLSDAAAIDNFVDVCLSVCLFVKNDTN